LECTEKPRHKSLGCEKTKLTTKNKNTPSLIRETTKFARKKPPKKSRSKNLFSNRHALSEIFSALILSSIVIIFGAFAYYYASTAATTATNNYVTTATNDQNALSERIGFENVVYTSTSGSGTLIVSIINCGSTSLQVKFWFVYDNQNQLVDTNHDVPPLTPLPGSQIAPDESLNVGKEGYFTVTLTPALTPGTTYRVDLITARGSSFDYTFAT
jgi:hypothetical protein